MNPISFRVYISRNLGKMIPFILIIALSLVVILMSKLFTKSVEDDYKTSTNFWTKYNTITVNTAEFRNGYTEINAALKNLNNAESVIVGMQKQITISTLLGKGAYEAHFVDELKVNTFVNTVGWRLVEGRMPIPAKDEILLTKAALKNKNLQVGDKIGSSVDANEDLKGDYTIVGALDGNNNITGAVGTVNPDEDVAGNWTFYIQPKEGKELELESELTKLKSNYRSEVVLKTHATAVQFQNEQFESLNVILWNLNFLTAGVMTMSIILLAYIFINGRLKEFAIFEALGYQRSRIILKVITEFGFVSIVAWTVGFVITELFSMLINYFLLDPVAITPISVLNLDIFIFSLPMLVILSLSLVVLVLLRFRKLDPILIIEQR